MNDKKEKYPYTAEDGTVLYRDYCFLIDGEKYNRNIACKKHDNAYGIYGGGDATTRKAADERFYTHLKNNKDPMAFWAYLAVRLLGWIFFNYHQGILWRGQLTKKIKRIIFFWKKA